MIEVKTSIDCYMGGSFKKAKSQFQINEDKYKKYKSYLTKVESSTDVKSEDKTKDFNTPGDFESEIIKAMNSLDHGDDSDWTQNGQPSLESVSDYVGRKVTRADITAIDPEFKRQLGE